ncbi:Cupredoxin [Mycena belliarum]|uniref:Cupredoxin n=1 Tax=Mycena belliarum TaxID=1033014 RepID=A0AAD6XV85_9AGAR|nr:Cupredoxin [Mycena belliae]
MLLNVGVALLFSSLAAAQYGYGAPSPPQTTTAAPAAAPVPSAPANTAGHMNINVAPGSFTFSPANISAPNGTAVTFWFPNTGINHSVTQSSFQNPCTPLAATANNPAGFDSGLTNSVQFTIVITDDTKPIWFHCKQVTHCGMGMVGSINANESSANSFSAFQAAAMKIGLSEPTETDNGPVTGGFNAIASAKPANTGAGASATPSKSPNSGMRVGFSIGAVLLGAAAVLGGMA